MRSFPLFPLGKHVSPKLSAGVLPGGGAGGAGLFQMGGETQAHGPPSASRGPVCPRGRPGRPRPRHPRGMISARAGQLVFAARPRRVNTDKTFQWTLQMSKCLLFRVLCQYLLGISSAGTRQRGGVPGSGEAGDPSPMSARQPGRLRAAA